MEIIVDSPQNITAAHKLDPDDLEILSFLGEASLSCGDSTAARSYAESVLEKVHILYIIDLNRTFHANPSGCLPFEGNCCQGRISLQYLPGLILSEIRQNNQSLDIEYCFTNYAAFSAKSLPLRKSFVVILTSLRKRSHFFKLSILASFKHSVSIEV